MAMTQKQLDEFFARNSGHGVINPKGKDSENRDGEETRRSNNAGPDMPFEQVLKVVLKFVGALLLVWFCISCFTDGCRALVTH